MPGGQGEQAAVPRAAANEPGAQTVQAAERGKKASWPAGHGGHSTAFKPLDLPTPQLLQLEAPPVEYEPPLQRGQLVAPDVAW